MRHLLRSSISTGFVVAAASTLVVAPAAPPTEPLSVPPVADVRLAASATSAPAAPPPGALLSQFLVNQLENCSLICPFIVQLAVEPTIRFAIIPVTFAAELQSGEPLLKAIAQTDATVSGAANAALTGIITNDLGLVLPRAQNALEVAVVGLIRIGTTAVTQPGSFLSAINTARSDFLAALQQPPGTMPPPTVNNDLEAGAVRVIEVVSALTFQAPERLLLGVTQAADAFFTTVGATGDIGSGLAAAGASVTTTVNESVAFVRRALTEPIPIADTPTGTTGTATATTTASTTATAETETTTPSSPARVRTSTTKPTDTVSNSVRRILKAGTDTASGARTSAAGATGSANPDKPTRAAGQDGHAAVSKSDDDDRSGPKHRGAGRAADGSASDE